MNLPKDKDIGWSAGFFDGEGSTCLGRNKDYPLNPQMVLVITQVDIRVLEKFKKIFETGNITYDRTRNANLYQETKFEMVQFIICCTWSELSQVKKDQYEKACKEYLSSRKYVRPIRKDGDLIHGTHTMYSNYKCRCLECKEFKRIYSVNYRKRKEEVLYAALRGIVERNASKTSS